MPCHQNALRCVMLLAMLLPLWVVLNPKNTTNSLRLYKKIDLTACLLFKPAHTIRALPELQLPRSRHYTCWVGLLPYYLPFSTSPHNHSVFFLSALPSFSSLTITYARGYKIILNHASLCYFKRSSTLALLYFNQQFISHGRDVVPGQAS
jgi:hypothetical protein